MSVFQGVAGFNCAGTGWSEVYYLSFTDYTTAMTALQSIITARMALSFSDVTCYFVRVSDVTIRGDALIALPTTPAGTRPTGTGGATMDTSLCLACRQDTADNLTRVRHYVRGLYSLDVTMAPTPLWTPVAGTITALTNYQNAVVTNCVAWVNRTAKPPVTKSFSTSTHKSYLSIRKAGRPFGLQVGRRRIA